MATEAPPVQKGEALDQDLVPRLPTAAELQQEDAQLLDALMRGDLATFSLWLQKNERELGEQPDPVEHANLLVRAARLFHSAREDEHAVRLLVRAARLMKGRGGEEANILAFLKQIGGEKGVAELKNQERRALREQMMNIQKELIAIGSIYDDTPQEKRDRHDELVRQLNELNRDEQKLR
jgi:hypothetical protein